jgi:hypothetical protein
MSRAMNDAEKNLIEALLLEDVPEHEVIARQLSSALVDPIDQNGSLKFTVQSDEKANVKSRVPVEAEAEDVDGVTIYILLHIVGGVINELEIFKPDLSQVIKMPEPNMLRRFVPYQANGGSK